MRERPESVLKRLAAEVERSNRIVISAVTYSEMRYGQIGKKASARHKTLVDECARRLDAVLPWDQNAVDAAVEVRRKLTDSGSLIGGNDTAIAGHAIASWSLITCVSSAVLQGSNTKTGCTEVLLAKLVVSSWAG
nr:type II toxin-antitoxin system VapC family toxin [Pseudomonas gingeri]